MYQLFLKHITAYMRSLREGNVFTRVCQSVCSWVGSPGPVQNCSVGDPPSPLDLLESREIGLQLKGHLSYHPSMKLREGNVCLSFCLGGPHMTIACDALDITVQFPHPSLGCLEIRPGTLSGPSPSDIRPGTPWPCLLLVTSSGHHWIPVQTCSF